MFYALGTVTHRPARTGQLRRSQLLLRRVLASATPLNQERYLLLASRLANIYSDMNQPLNALAVCDSWLKHPSAERFLPGALAKAYLRTGNYQQARKHALIYLNKMRERKEYNNDRTFEALIRAEMFLNKWDQAKADTLRFGNYMVHQPSAALSELIATHDRSDWSQASKLCEDILLQGREQPYRILYEYWDLDLELFADIAKSQGRKDESRLLRESTAELRRLAATARY
jgi:predicted Zn-dependent protease